MRCLTPVAALMISGLFLISVNEVSSKTLPVQATSVEASVTSKVAEPAQILWAVPDWPPFFVKDKNLPPGVANQMLQLLQTQLPAYQHQEIDVNSPKLVELWQQGRKICGSNILYNGERAKYGYFTPLWIYPPLSVIVKEESLEAFTKGEKPINVFELIRNSHFKGVLIKGRSYGPPVDDIVAKLSEKEFVSLIAPMGNWQDYLNMIPGGRADYTIDYAKVAKLFNETHPHSKRLAAIAINGYEKPFIVNVACTKNPWGKEIIKDLDGKIQTLAKGQAYKDLLEKIFANDTNGIQPKDVDQFILKRAKGPWFWGSME